VVIFPSDSKVPALIVLAGCSGAQSLVLFLAVFGMMLIDFRSKVSGKKLAGLFLIGITFIFFANLLRIPFLAYIAYAYGNDALNIAHIYSGTPFFMGATALFWILSMKIISNSKQAQKLGLRSTVSY